VANFRGRGFAAIPEVFYDHPTIMNVTQSPSAIRQIIQTGIVVNNPSICRDHFRITVRVPQFEDAQPGQFVHLCPTATSSENYRTEDDPWAGSHDAWWNDLQSPLLRRAFSVADLSRGADGVDIDVMYRVVGTATRWLASLRVRDAISVMGPLGRPFPIARDKPIAWLVAGGVGLPPLLWLAKALNKNKKRAVAFCGAQSRDLLALTLEASTKPVLDARTATMSAREFAEVDTPVVMSTDDGSLGFRGHVGAALMAYSTANPAPNDSLVVYTCGPERMMRFVAEFCAERDIECFVCVERNMACGTGMCQSCIVPVHDTDDAAGWRYRLCCTEGPVFDSRAVIWD
jgi:dihydroorotate dehydrogenase electron transfer subunit